MRLRASSLRWPLLGTAVPVLLAACLPGGRLPEMPVRKGNALRAQARGAQAGKDGLRAEMISYGFYPTNDILDALEGAVKIALERAASHGAIPSPTGAKRESVVATERW